MSPHGAIGCIIRLTSCKTFQENVFQYAPSENNVFQGGKVLQDI
jgi:hypothetical protein